MTDDRSPRDGTVAAIAAIVASGQEPPFDASQDAGTIVRYLCRMASQLEAEEIEEVALRSGELRRNLAATAETLGLLQRRPWPDVIKMGSTLGFEGEVARAWIRLAERMVPAMASMSAIPRRFSWSDLRLQVRAGIEDAFSAWALLTGARHWKASPAASLRPVFYRDARADADLTVTSDSPPSAWIEDGDLCLALGPAHSHSGPEETMGVYMVTGDVILTLAEELSRATTSFVRIPSFGRDLGWSDGFVGFEWFVVGEPPEAIPTHTRSAPVPVSIEMIGGDPLMRALAASLRLGATRSEGGPVTLLVHAVMLSEVHLAAYDLVVEILVSPGAWQVVGHWGLNRVASEAVSLDLPGASTDGNAGIPPLRARLEHR